MRAAMVVSALIASAAPASAGAQRCTFDHERYDHMQPEGFGEALLCGGEKVWGITIRYSGKRLTAVKWDEQQGQRKRHTYLYDDGAIAFIAHDEGIKSKSFFKQTRGTKYYTFPRGGRMAIAKDTGSNRLFVRDAAGHTWVLVGTDVPSKYVPAMSWAVESIDGVTQKPAAIDFSVTGIVGVDLAKARAFFLETKQPNLSGLADRRSTKFRETKSVFRDGTGQSCSVANGELFGGSARDPDDKSEYELLFTTDSALDTFLGETCPKLDRSSLGVVLEQ
ncbi:MAG TPA: hypothetical protein VIV11_21210 [Kofleriaceae bacterium]